MNAASDQSRKDIKQLRDDELVDFIRDTVVRLDALADRLDALADHAPPEQEEDKDADRDGPSSGNR